jgi:hypothetical protein
MFVSNLRLAWQDSSTSTPALSCRRLLLITGKKLRTSVGGHFAVLRNKHAALRLQSAGQRHLACGEVLYIIVFTDWVRPEIKPSQDCKNLQNEKIIGFLDHRFL